MKKYNEQALSPVAFYGIGLLPIIIVCTSALNALKFGAIIFVAMMACGLLYVVFKPIINDNVRIPCYMLIIVGVEYCLDSILSEFSVESASGVAGLTSYLFVATIIIFAFETSGRVKSGNQFLVDSAIMSVDYAVCMLVVGIFRELLSVGKVFNIKIFNGGIELFASGIGTILIICVYAILYNSIIGAIKKRKSAYYGLVDRYGMYLDSKYLPLQTAKSSYEIEKDKESAGEGEK